MSDDLTRLTAAETAAAIAGGDASAAEVTDAHLARIEAVDPDVHAFLHVDADRRPGRCPPDRRAARCRRAARPAGRRTAGTQGRHRHRGRADDLRVADARGLAAAVRRDRRAPAARRRRRDPRQDQHGRVRHGQLDRALGVRAHPQPVGPRPHPRRLRWRVGGRGGRVRGAARRRHRHRRLDPAAGLGHRHGRREADVRRREPLRPRRAGLLARPGRALRPHRARRRAAARHHRRPRPARLDVDRRTGARRGRRRAACRTSPACASAS